MMMSMIKSSVGKKFLMGLTGLAFCGFLVEHLTGNFLLLVPDSAPYNKYAHFLTGFGELLYIAEFILLGAFVVHVATAISVTRKKKIARPIGYISKGNAGLPSQKSMASTSMIITGMILLVFVVVHLINFKFGAKYTVEIGHESVRDLYRLVHEKFGKGSYVIGYVAVMFMLGMHLRHGFWSAFQSLGMSNSKYTAMVRVLGIFISSCLGFGFLAIPVLIYIGTKIGFYRG